MKPRQLKTVLVATVAAALIGILFSPWRFFDDSDLVDAIVDLDGQWVDRQAPGFELPDRQGRIHQLSEYHGQVVFLNFWASFCEPCRREMPSMESLVRQYESQGLTMVAVSLDSDWSEVDRFMAAFLPGQRSAMTVLLDSSESLAQTYGTELIPETYIIDREGRIVARFAGDYDWTRPEVKQIIEGLL